MKIARRLEKGALHGALLEILEDEVGTKEMTLLNDLRSTGRTAAYHALFNDIFLEQNINLLNGRAFTFQSTTSGILQQDDVRQAATDANNGYSIVGKDIECKSIKGDQSYNSRKDVVKRAAEQIFSRAAEQVIDHHLEARPVIVEYAINDVGLVDMQKEILDNPRKYPKLTELVNSGMQFPKDVPRMLPSVFEAILGRTMDNIENDFAECMRSGGGAVYARMDLATLKMTFAPQKRWARLEYDMYTQDANGAWTVRTSMTEIVPWDKATPARSDAFVDQIYNALKNDPAYFARIMRLVKNL